MQFPVMTSALMFLSAGGCNDYMSQPRIIGLMGKPGAGKDTVGALLSMLGYQRRSFGDLVRDEITHYVLSGEIEKLFDKMPPRLRVGTMAEYNVRERSVGFIRDLNTKPTSPLMRELLQWWGIDLRRDQDPNYWVRKMKIGLSPDVKEVVTDLRFGNEYTAVLREGGKIWRVLKGHKDYAEDDHVAETAHLSLQADLEIKNNLDIHHLAAEVRKALGTV